MSKARGFGLGATALAVALTVTACGSSNSNDSKESAGSQESSKAGSSVKLGITWAGSQVRHDATLAALDLYSKNNPNVTFEPSYMGFDTYFTKLATLSAARNLPDIMQIDTGNLMDYALRDQLTDLSAGIDTSNINDKLLSAGKVNGTLYGIPLGANAITFMYNKAAFDKLGIQVPEKGFTWDEWLKIAKETQPKLEKGKYFMMDLSMATGTTESDKYEIYQLAQGKGFIHTPDGKFNIDRDTYLAFNKLFADLRKEGVVPPADVTAGHKQYDPQLDLFMNGTILVQRDYSAGFPNFESVHPGQYAMAPVPSASNAGGFMLPSQFFTVSKASKHPDEAKKFIDWFVNDKEAGRTLTLARGVPVSKPVLDDLTPTLDSSAKAQIDIIDRVAPDANPFSSRPKGFGAWTDEWTKISQAVAFDKMTPEQAYDELKKKWDEIVKL
ncbi:ABC transporter substrate-binding protein [Cohnella zeiphila]|uniref:Extracellular solute-binding protein n=1 Tax=Cohnella zeiphila TaxID=2761120 RepID=A0A7X0SRC1_9BACL|nr:extracellular solute-binding protein [Cohnella zeiphila]MBB6734728.1 extracellular solute-binding protein [Cohnella zeiphila]